MNAQILPRVMRADGPGRPARSRAAITRTFAASGPFGRTDLHMPWGEQLDLTPDAERGSSWST